MIRRSAFKPAWWLRNPHLQTMWPVFMRPRLAVETRIERFDLPDGDFTDIVWVNEKMREQKIVVMLHGLAGSIESQYIRGLMQQCIKHDWCAVLLHFRGCSGRPNRLPRNYHSGDSDDLAYFVSTLARQYPNAILTGVGFSLGGNVLLKWLGETGTRNPLEAAVAVSVPFDLHKAAYRVNHGFSRIYQWRILRDIRNKLLEKYNTVQPPVDIETLKQINNFYDFDNTLTAPLHGFRNAFDYYSKTSSRQFLKKIRVPTLIIQAADDPLFSTDLVVYPHELSSSVLLEYSPQGGHVGFISGNNPLKPIYWLEQRIPEYLSQAYAKAAKKPNTEHEAIL